MTERKKGSTLTEFLIVTGIIFVLATIVFSSLKSLKKREAEKFRSAQGGKTASQLEQITLKVSEGSYIGGVWMHYSGMSNSDTFCLSRENRTDYAGLSHYYPVEAKKIHFYDHDYEVLYVNPEEIKLERAE